MRTNTTFSAVWLLKTFHIFSCQYVMDMHNKAPMTACDSSYVHNQTDVDATYNIGTSN